MPIWGENDFLAAAKQAAEAHSGEGTPLNDATAAIAEQHGLSPEQIRTLVRLANIAAFQQHYAGTEGAEDRGVEFETGDPEAVIQKLILHASPEQEAPAQAPPSGMYEDVEEEESEEEESEEEESEEEEEEKTASLQIRQARPRTAAVTLRLRKTADEMEIRAKQADYRWLENLEKAAQWVRQQGTHKVGAALDALEKSAVCLYGSDAEVEVRGLRKLLRYDGSGPHIKNAAYLQSHYVADDGPGMTAFKVAHEARLQYQALERALRQVEADVLDLEARLR